VFSVPSVLFVLTTRMIRRKDYFGSLAVLVLALWAGVCSARTPSGPFERFEVLTGGGPDVPQARIVGWYLPAKPASGGKPHGTLFICHGYNQSKEGLAGWEWIRDKLGWDVVMFDFRRHGESSNPWPPSTLGYYEAWDLRAVIDWAEKRGSARPFAAYGVSMGAATALREASDDPRITGVLAVSPFRNALVGAEEMMASKHATWLGEHLMPPDYRETLAKVDIVRDVAKRSDLRVWIMSGERDCFPPADQRAILAGCASPDRLKRLVIAPGKTHHNVWTWKGDGVLPGHDEYVRAFLSETATDQRGTRWKTPMIVMALVGVGAIPVLMRRGTRGRREDRPGDGPALVDSDGSGNPDK